MMGIPAAAWSHLPPRFCIARRTNYRRSCEGILPTSEYLNRQLDTYGTDAYRRYPTLLSLASGDSALVAICCLEHYWR